MNNEQPGCGVGGERLGEAGCHHCVVLLGSTLCVPLPRLAETFAASLEGGLINLAIAFDDINGLAVSIVVGGDLHGASVPSHRSSTTGEGFNKDHGLAWGHP